MRAIKRRDLLRALCENNSLQDFCALLKLELEASHEDMEAAQTEIEIWRSQGRALVCRELLHNLNKKEGNGDGY